MLQSGGRVFRILSRDSTDPTDSTDDVPQPTLWEFVRAAWHVLEPAQPFVDNWHVGAICELLTAVSDGQIQNLLINIPPRHMKSLLVSVFWPCWEWGPRRRPDLRYINSSYASHLSIRDLRCGVYPDLFRFRNPLVNPWGQHSQTDGNSEFSANGAAVSG